MDLPDEMTHITISSYGGPEVLKPARTPVPIPREGELLIHVQAAGVNRPDVLQRMGKYPLPADASPIPGLEVAGEVVQLGAGVKTFKTGDRVCALTNGGGYAEYCVVPTGQALPWPQGFTAVQAAAIPETYFTVWANLFQMGHAKFGETILVHGGTSGIGTTAIQLAQAFGIHVIATAGSDEKCAAIQNLGAVAINYRTQDFVEVAKSNTGGRGVDAILDIVGAAYFHQNINALALDGRLLLIGFLGGARVDGFDLSQIMTKRIVVTGSAMRPRSPQEKAGIAQELLADAWPHLGKGKIEPIIHATFPLDSAADAHRLMESSDHIGKIVLTVDEPAA